ncbi:MAG: hypothetical protein MR775_05155 [Erysipelotrichaceae bacterium]|nr:hypothetical protein [Erysipelotrichaceae bacterium]
MSTTKFIQISNNTPTVIGVIPSIMLIDATNKYSPVKDRLNVKPAWMNMKVDIVPGVGWYPLEIKEWDAVKSFAKTNKFTIGVETDASGVPSEWLEKAEEMSRKLTNAKAKYNADIERNAKILEADKNRPGAE